jgi:hypothetical protein
MCVSQTANIVTICAVHKTLQSRQEKQLAFLMALSESIQAEHKGEVNQAREYLLLAKESDPLIEASDGGLPVDMGMVSSIQNLFMHDVTDI